MKITVFLGVALACSSALAQTVDYALEIKEGGVPVPGGNVVYAMVVTANYWTDAKEPFVVRMNVPQGLEPVSQCTGDLRFEAGTRVVTWADRLDNPVIAFNSCPLLFRVDPSLVPGTTFTLSATLATASSDPNLANNSATHSGVVLASSDLEVKSASDVRTFKPGSTVTYTFTVTNHGPNDAREVILTDDISQFLTALSFEQTAGPPALLFATQASISLLPVGGEASFRLTARTKPEFEAANIRNHLVVQSASVDVNLRDNERDLFTFFGPDADLAVESVRAPGPADRIPIMIRVTNDGPDAVKNVMISNALAGTDGRYDFVERVRYVSLTPSQGSCSMPVQAEIFAELRPPRYWSADCSLGALAPGAAATIQVVIETTVGAGAFQLASYANPAQNDPRPENNAGRVIVDAPRLRRRGVSR